MQTTRTRRARPAISNTAAYFAAYTGASLAKTSLTMIEKSHAPIQGRQHLSNENTLRDRTRTYCPEITVRYQKDLGVYETIGFYMTI